MCMNSNDKFKRENRAPGWGAPQHRRTPNSSYHLPPFRPPSKANSTYQQLQVTGSADSHNCHFNRWGLATGLGIGTNKEQAHIPGLLSGCQIDLTCTTISSSPIWEREPSVVWQWAPIRTYIHQTRSLPHLVGGYVEI